MRSRHVGTGYSSGEVPRRTVSVMVLTALLVPAQVMHGANGAASASTAVNAATVARAQVTHVRSAITSTIGHHAEVAQRGHGRDAMRAWILAAPTVRVKADGGGETPTRDAVARI